MSHLHLRFAAFFVRLHWFISQLMTGFRGASLPHYDHVGEVIDALGHGDRYKKDRPLAGLRNPKNVQWRLNHKKRPGDCEDHAGYWALSLLKSILSLEAYIGCVYYEIEGKKYGHAVCVFTLRSRPDEYFWADYSLPRALPNKGAWVDAVQAIYASRGKPRGAFLFRVAPYGPLGSLRIIDTELYPLQKG